MKKLKAKLKTVFNKYIRLRDKDKRCISCGGPVQQAGHYYSTSQCPQPSMVFNEQNVHGQCISCNMFKEGNRQGYLKGLNRRYGPDYVMSLEVKRSIKQDPWQRFQYEAMIRHYTKLVKEMS
jgi:ubiquitin